MNYKCMQGPKNHCYTRYCKSCFNQNFPALENFPTGAKINNYQMIQALQDDPSFGCFKCKNGYSKSLGNTECIRSQNGCLTFDIENDVCTLCDYGWYMNKHMNCIKGKNNNQSWSIPTHQKLRLLS